jgi:hypothetical protein
MTRRSILATMLLCGPLLAQRAKTSMTVYKDPNCGCCDKWIQHLKNSGFDVVVKEMTLPDLRQLKTRHNIPSKMQTCHTGVVDGYVIEGHVPPADVQRLLKERPKGAGLAVPGMPIGSPGMEGQNNEAYSVLLFDSAGRTSVFKTYPKR